MTGSKTSLDSSGAPRVSPLHAYWAARVVTNEWQLVSGMTLPDVVTGLDAEMAVLAAGAGFGDISCRMALAISGPELSGFLAQIFAGSSIHADPGRSSAVLWAQSQGYVRGSGGLSWMAEDLALVTSQVWDAGWLHASAQGFEVEVAPAVSAGVGLRLAGPRARACIEDTNVAGAWDAPGVGPVHVVEIGTMGLDLWCSPDQGGALAALLSARGAVPVGQAALESWRIQAGLLRPYRDWTPVQAAQDWAMARRLSDFDGAGGGFAHARIASEDRGHDRWTSLAHWPAIGARFGLGWLGPGKVHQALAGETILGVPTTD